MHNQSCCVWCLWNLQFVSRCSVLAVAYLRLLWFSSFFKCFMGDVSNVGARWFVLYRVLASGGFKGLKASPRVTAKCGLRDGMLPVCGCHGNLCNIVHRLTLYKNSCVSNMLASRLLQINTLGLSSKGALCNFWWKEQSLFVCVCELLMPSGSTAVAWYTVNSKS